MADNFLLGAALQPNYYGGSHDNTTNSYATYGAAVGYNYFLTPGAALEV